MSSKEIQGELSIGQVARQTGVAASALRYYEKEGLLKPPRRVSGKRRFSPSVVSRIVVIRFAQQVGFSIAETRTLLQGFDREGLPKTWSRMAKKKLVELETDEKRIKGMRKILSFALSCGCADLERCAGAIQSAAV